MLRNVVALATPQQAVFELAVACEVFGIDRSEQGLPTYDFAVAATVSSPVQTRGGFEIHTRHGLERTESADLIIIPAWHAARDVVPDELIECLRNAVERGARIMTYCTGAFVLAATGLLDGRRATTHWMHADALAARFPAIDVDPQVLYVDDDPLITAAGTAAGIDASLHLVRKEQGSAVANAIARRMVVPPHRDGGQAQFVAAPVAPRRDEDQLAGLTDWLLAHIEDDISIEDLAAVVHQSPRTFARQFRQRTGTTPYAWLLDQRLLRAQELLERGDLGVDEVARRAGLGSAATLRHHFRRTRGVGPQAFRQTFSGSATQRV